MKLQILAFFCVSFDDEVLDDSLTEGRAVEAASIAEAAYRLQSQTSLGKKLDIYG
jgi:hypothetical protein